MQVPEDEIEAITDLPYLADLKAKDSGDLKVLTLGPSACAMQHDIHAVLLY